MCDSVVVVNDSGGGGGGSGSGSSGGSGGGGGGDGVDCNGTGCVDSGRGRKNVTAISGITARLVPTKHSSIHAMLLSRRATKGRHCMVVVIMCMYAKWC